jgi:hypothetical protein
MELPADRAGNAVVTLEVKGPDGSFSFGLCSNCCAAAIDRASKIIAPATARADMVKLVPGFPGFN